MLKILRAGDAFASPCALLLGAFDGLHLGHGALLEAARGTHLPIGFTSIFGGKGGELFSAPEREHIFDQVGAAFVSEIFFGKAKDLTAEEFLARLFAKIDVRALFCGEDFRFGRGAAGTTELLRACAPCPVTVLPLVEADGGKVATSACKALLSKGEMGALDELLVRPYFIQGVVEHGRQVGRTYGFPTLNLTPPPEKLLPPDGVYGGLCATTKGSFPTILNIGARPTFGVAERKIEAYLDGFSGDLYGETVRIYPMKLYRPIEKFSSAEALKAQLQKDISRLRSEHTEFRFASS